MKEYFKFGKQIIAINMIGSDVQDRGNGLDMDSDSGYTTNQPDIVEHAKKCYQEYPTIVNNIPKSSKRYANTMDSFAAIDNGLAASQTDIGESSNLAQLAQTYAATYPEEIKYQNYVCILSVLAQVAIDNAKRQFDITLSDEIKLIKDDMDIRENGYPEFWKFIKRNFKGNINDKLHCPMNYLCGVEFKNSRSSECTLPMSYFFQKFELDTDRRNCKKVEEIISRYSLKLNLHNQDDDRDYESYLLLRSDFADLISEIRSIHISKNYVGLMSYLIDRAFIITPQVKRNEKSIRTKINKNKSLLLKVLYDVNSKNLLSCFGKNVK